MLLPFTLTAVSLLASTTPMLSSKVAFEQYGPPKELPPFSVLKEFEPLVETTEVAIRGVEKPKRLVCKSCNTNEQRTLAFFQEEGITDKNALATILGNIRQESTFVPNICEGGARVSYSGCRRGGYGLIQWTSTNRYLGLGNFAQKYGGSPSTLDTQLRYLVNEVQWRRIEPQMKTPGRTINSYMSSAYSWIGWGHHGYRTHYAQDYASRFTWEA